MFWTLLRSNAYEFFKILCFSCQGKSRDIVYQRICLFVWLIFAQHGLFEIQLTVYTALSRLTDLGIYDITRCGIWLLTIFHIPYIQFQRELRKVTSPKWYLSFLFSIYQYLSRRLSDVTFHMVNSLYTFHYCKRRSNNTSFYYSKTGVLGHHKKTDRHTIGVISLYYTYKIKEEIDEFLQYITQSIVPNIEKGRLMILHASYPSRSIKFSTYVF